MANIALESGVASEFIQYLTRQLDEAREQLQRSNEDNVALRAQLRVGDPLLGGSPATHSVAASSTEVKQEVKSLRKELKRVRKELDDTQESATRYEAEAASWRTRYQQLEPILAIPEIHEGQTLEKMRQELAACATIRDESSTGQTLKQFRAVLRSFPDIANSVDPGAFKPVFGGMSPPQLSKTVHNACIGDICFFGDSDLLRWFTPSPQHAYAVLPAHQYKWKAPKDEPAWVAADDLASFVGQLRELLYVNDGKICYAGTFLCHAGPKPVKVAKLAKLGDEVDESFVHALARKTLHVTTKNSQTRPSKMNSFAPLIADLYNEGSARVRILGLQRVGFNKELFQILRSAYEQRAQKAAAGSSAPAKDVKPPGKARTHAAQRKGKKGNKRPRGGRKGGRARPGKSKGAEECAPRPAKIRRLA